MGNCNCGCNRGISGSLDNLLEICGESTIPKSGGQPTVTSYNALTDKPIINDVTVQGRKRGIDYHLQDKMDVLTTQEIERILYLDQEEKING